MDTGYRTPLLDYFRRGDVPRDVKLLAATGELAPRAHEQIAVLLCLVDDGDGEVADLANRTIARIPVEPLAAFLARSDVSNDTRAFFAARGVQPASSPRPSTGTAQDDALPLLDAGGELPVVTLAEGGQVSTAGSTPDAGDAGETVQEPPPEQGVQVSALSVPDKLKLAMRGTREQRALLIRDSNRMVAAAVLSSPKLTEAEVEGFSKMANVAEEVLRVIGSSRVWTRNYMVSASLVKNPKTPSAIALTLLPRLNERDVKFVSNDRGVPEAVRLAARKFLAAGQARRG